jgi:hypothetical protein
VDGARRPAVVLVAVTGWAPLRGFRPASEIARVAPEVDEILAWFSDQRALPYESFEVPRLPGAADVVDELKQRSVSLASGGKRAIGGLAGKVRFHKGGGAEVQALEPGRVPAALPAKTGEAGEPDANEVARRISKARLSAMTRIRRAGAGDVSGANDIESERDSSTVDEV